MYIHLRISASAAGGRGGLTGKKFQKYQPTANFPVQNTCRADFLDFRQAMQTIALAAASAKAIPPAAPLVLKARATLINMSEQESAAHAAALASQNGGSRSKTASKDTKTAKSETLKAKQPPVAQVTAVTAVAVLAAAAATMAPTTTAVAVAVMAIAAPATCAPPREPTSSSSEDAE